MNAHRADSYFLAFALKSLPTFSLAGRVIFPPTAGRQVGPSERLSDDGPAYAEARSNLAKTDGARSERTDASQIDTAQAIEMRVVTLKTNPRRIFPA